MAQVFFWLFLGMIVYAYLGYPLVLLLLSRIFEKPVRKKRADRFVSVIISAFNEGAAIERKLRNLLELNYPPERLEILIGSDGASDRTDEIVSRFHSTQIRFFRFVENLGKPHVLSALVEEARGEIIVFTDTRQELDREAIHALVENFEDPEVGCVSGELYFKREGNVDLATDRGSVEGGMDVYWRYEKFLRKRESQMGSMLGATGAIYAIRKSLFPKLMPPYILVDDMYVPLQIIKRGYRAIFESEAKAYDRPSERGVQEFKRKVRTLAGNYQLFVFFPELFLPWKSPIAWQLFSHKFLRLMVPFFLLGLFLTNLLILNHSAYQSFFLAQCVFYGIAVIEVWQLRRRQGKKGIGYLPYTFCLLNYSAVVGLIRFVAGKQKSAWEKAYV